MRIIIFSWHNENEGRSRKESVTGVYLTLSLLRKEVDQECPLYDVLYYLSLQLTVQEIWRRIWGLRSAFGSLGGKNPDDNEPEEEEMIKRKQSFSYWSVENHCHFIGRTICGIALHREDNRAGIWESLLCSLSSSLLRWLNSLRLATASQAGGT